MRGLRTRTCRSALLVAASALLPSLLSDCGGDKGTGPVTPSALVRAAGDGQSGFVGQALTNALRVRVTDTQGSGVAGVVIVWSVTTGGGSLSAATSTTDGTGAASVVWTLGTLAGGQTVSASAPAVPSLPAVTFTAAAIPGAPAALAFIVQPTEVTAGAAFRPALQVAVLDSFGNRATTSTGITMSIGANPGSGALSGTTTVASTSGLAIFWDLSINRAGSGYTLTATASGVAAATSNTVNVVPGVASKLAFAVQPSGALAGAAVNPAVQVSVQDALGNTVTGSTAAITLKITTGTGAAGATLSGTAAKAAVAGVATYGDLSIDKADSGYSLTASNVGLVSATSGVFAISAGAARKLAFTEQPTAVSAGGVVGPAVQVTVQDALGNTATGSAAAVTMAITAGTGAVGATLGGGLTRPAEAGVATFADLSVDEDGAAYTLTASGGSLTAATSAPFDVYEFATVTSHCGLTTGGSAWCWGENTLGSLGSGSPYPYVAVPVAAAAQVRFVALTGESVVCGLTSGGAAYCWGHNIYGAVGDGSRVNRPTPVAVSGGLSFAQLSSRSDHTCGVTTSGAAYCWGADWFGELGDGLSDNVTGGSRTSRATPDSVLGGLRFSAVSTGAFHTCGLTTVGDAYCWGANDIGQLGDGTMTERTSPVSVSGGLRFVALSAGSGHTCGLTSTGAAYCWGFGVLGQLGDGAGATSLTPIAVAGGLAFSSISAGGWSTCGVATSGDAYCWGDNVFGQIGDGSTNSGFVPVAVSGGNRFRTVAQNGATACGVTTDNVTYCWGSNGAGQLGIGSVYWGSPVPVRVH